MSRAGGFGERQFLPDDRAQRAAFELEIDLLDPRAVQEQRPLAGHDDAGQAVDVPMFETMVEWMSHPLYYTHFSGRAPKRSGPDHATTPFHVVV